MIHYKWYPYKECINLKLRFLLSKKCMWIHQYSFYSLLDKISSDLDKDKNHQDNCCRDLVNHKLSILKGSLYTYHHVLFPNSILLHKLCNSSNLYMLHSLNGMHNKDYLFHRNLESIHCRSHYYQFKSILD